MFAVQKGDWVIHIYKFLINSGAELARDQGFSASTLRMFQDEWLIVLGSGTVLGTAGYLTASWPLPSGYQEHLSCIMKTRNVWMSAGITKYPLESKTHPWLRRIPLTKVCQKVRLKRIKVFSSNLTSESSLMVFERIQQTWHTHTHSKLGSQGLWLGHRRV